MAAQSTPTDFVMIDTEHSATNVRALENLIRTAEAAGVILYVHVPDLHSEVDILRRGKSVQGHRQTSHEIKKKDRLATVSLKPIRNRLRSYPSRRSMPLKRDRSCDWARASGAADAERDIRGFALRLYYEATGTSATTTCGFFARDPVKFPDFIHMQKYHPEPNMRSPAAM